MTSGGGRGRVHGRACGRARGVARRDRHGRGLRGRLVPPNVPLSRSRSQQFDDLVAEAVEHLEHRWGAELDGVEFAVEDVPQIEHLSPDVTYGTDVIEDGNVPLARLLPARPDRQGRMAPPRIVVFRRPLETRAQDLTELADLVHDVVVEQVANLLGLDPDEIDPMD
ncbi:MAG TPA: metallopeptidase family protein [Mycobacteriales bacterium]|nr:metallopeptidase family protein [Mycobacteriales bacterium]